MNNGYTSLKTITDRTAEIEKLIENEKLTENEFDDDDDLSIIPKTEEDNNNKLLRKYIKDSNEDQEKIDKNTNIWKKRLSILIPLILIGILVVIVIYFMTKSDDTPENVTSAYRVDNTYK